jgi:hypothetical protein
MISRTRWTAMLVLLAVLLVGTTCGVVLGRVAEDIAWLSFRPDRGAAPGERGDHAMDAGAIDGGDEEEFLEGLDLSRAQNDAVARLLEDRDDQLEAYWEGKLPEIEALIDSNRAAIRGLLPPDHRAAYDRWVARQREESSRP